MPSPTALLGLFRATLIERQRLLLENAALRHQLAVLKRSVKSPRIEDSDRIFWIVMRRMMRDWKDCLSSSSPPPCSSGTDGRPSEAGEGHQEHAQRAVMRAS